jgi:hypothetical protein
MEPVSHFFYSDRLKLHFRDYGGDRNPAVTLVPWAQGAMYSMAEYVCDLSALLDVIGEFPMRLVEGFGFPEGRRVHSAYPDRLRRWVEGFPSISLKKPRFAHVTCFTCSDSSRATPSRHAC